jgi:hypothetical protein
LLTYLREHRDYRSFVKVDPSRDSVWTPVASEHGGVLRLALGGEIGIDRVRAFVVAYGSGEILDAVSAAGPLPEGVHWVATPAQADGSSPRLPPTEEEIRAGEMYMKLTFGRSGARPRNSTYYSTSLTNVSRDITNAMFTSQQFREWYGTRDEQGWIAPGETVMDPNNYGSPFSLWTYFGESEGGATFVVAGIAAETTTRTPTSLA